MVSFDNVSHSWLLKFLQVRIKDPSFLLLIRRFLSERCIQDVLPPVVR
jgi:retron-type reverse transcriptase